MWISVQEGAMWGPLGLPLPPPPATSRQGSYGEGGSSWAPSSLHSTQTCC